MTTQNKPQPARTITIIDLSDGQHVGTLTTIAVCRPSWFEELLLMRDRGAIRLALPSCLTIPEPTHGNLLVLGMERTRAGDPYAIGESICILPEEQWPAADSQFDDFCGSLRTCLGQQIRWQTTISATQDDPRLGRIIVQYDSRVNGLRSFELSREDAPVSRKVSVSRPIV